ncbi:MAG: cache domain-containing protein [Spirochaetes bacterium]|nr:cache domain-containing protein [Spirochaetota bacterium]MBU1081549.1 cache domain-containing protein [Spirochaetota bacterium]
MHERTVISGLLAAIFLAFVALTAFFSESERRTAREFIVERELPALGLAASAQLDISASKYKRAGEELLRDGFIRDWILDGERDVPALRDFMKGVRAQYGLLDASIVSDLTETYYGTDGRVLQLSPAETERDGWYYLYRESATGSNIDAWYYPETGVVGVYVNIPILDRDGTYLGVTGGGIDTIEFSRIIASYETEKHISVYLARRDGELVYATDKSLLRDRARGLDGLWGEGTLEKLRRGRSIAAGISLEPAGSGGPALWARYLEDWDTYLVVERDAEAIASLSRAATLRAVASISALAIVLLALTIGGFFIADRSIKNAKNRDGRELKRCGAVADGLLALLRDAEPLLPDESTRQYRKALEEMLDGAEARPEHQRSLRGVVERAAITASENASRRGVAIIARVDAVPDYRLADGRLASFAFGELLRALAEAAAKGSEILVSGGGSGQGARVDIVGGSGLEATEPRRFRTIQYLLESQGAIAREEPSDSGLSVYTIRFSNPPRKG